MAFATNEDLMDYAPEIFDQGVDDWTAEINRAQNDVEDQIRIRWYNKYHSNNTWELSKVTESQWTRATVYRALFAHILPKLTTFRPEGDPFREQISFWKERYEEELDTQFALGIEYDTNGDGTVQDGEITEFSQTRLYR